MKISVKVAAGKAIPAERVEAALARPFVARCTGTGRDMPGFLMVEHESVATNQDLADGLDVVLAYVESMPPKEPKPPKRRIQMTTDLLHFKVFAIMLATGPQGAVPGYGDGGPVLRRNAHRLGFLVIVAMAVHSVFLVVGAR